MSRSANIVLHADLNALATPGSLVICDIEGFEFVLIDPEKAPALKEVDLLVEIHAFEGSSPSLVRETILARFRDTHTISVVGMQTRDANSYITECQELSDIDEPTLAFALDEFRDLESTWIWMETITSSSSSVQSTVKKNR